MKIDGKFIAGTVKETLGLRIANLKHRNIYPHLAVILVGDDASSHAYVRQKKKVGAEIGIEVSLYILPETTAAPLILDHVKQLNQDPDIHGIIVQRPIPINIPADTLDIAVIPEKDVDGFHPTSLFAPPIAAAVMRILEWVYQDSAQTQSRVPSGIPASLQSTFFQWLREKNIVIIGRGVTAGKPIAHIFEKHAISHTVAHSKTEQFEKISQSADIIISCVGKNNIVRHHMVHKNTVLIGVGLHTEQDRLAPDYDQEEMADIVAYYTPVPGGVGPVNVACLLENVVIAAEKIAKPIE